MIKWQKELLPSTIGLERLSLSGWDDFLTKLVYKSTSWYRFSITTISADLQDMYSMVGHVDTDGSSEYSITGQMTNMIGALLILRNTQQFLTTPLVFEKVILSANALGVRFDEIQICTPEELSYGISEVTKIMQSRDYDYDVIEYIRACCEESGLLVYPAEFSFSQRFFPEESFELKIYNDYVTRKFEYTPSQRQKEILEGVTAYTDFMKDKLRGLDYVLANPTARFDKKGESINVSHTNN